VFLLLSHFDVYLEKMHAITGYQKNFLKAPVYNIFDFHCIYFLNEPASAKIGLIFVALHYIKKVLVNIHKQCTNNAQTVNILIPQFRCEEWR
jgi:hypothetical protein